MVQMQPVLRAILQNIIRIFLLENDSLSPIWQQRMPMGMEVPFMAQTAPDSPWRWIYIIIVLENRLFRV